MYNDYCQAPIFQNFVIDDVFYKSLPKKHIIRTLMEEHQVLLNLGKVLKQYNREVQKNDNLQESTEIIQKLQMVSGTILSSEKHHLREDNTFIRRLVSMAEFEPSQNIRQQHDDLGVLKRKLERTVYGVYTTPFNIFKEDLKKVSRNLPSLLKKHIKLEDNILYPQAVKMIPGEARWNKMREESDKIGYCCFTPQIR